MLNVFQCYGMRPCMSISGSVSLPIRPSLRRSVTLLTRPIRPTIRPPDDEMIVWWRNYMRVILAYFCFDLLESTDRWTDEPNDRSYRYSRMLQVGLVDLSKLFARKYWLSSFLTKAWPTDGRIDVPTDIIETTIEMRVWYLGSLWPPTPLRKSF